MLELKIRLGRNLSKSLRPKAPILLKKLQKAHPAKDSSGAEIDGSFDGIAMFKALLAMREDDVSDWLSGRCEDVYDIIS